MKKVLSSMIAVAIAGATSGAFAQPTRNSDETTLERSIQVPKDGVRVDEKKSTTTTTTTPAVKAESKSTTTTTTSERKADGDTKVEVKAKTKTETENKY
jgi:uncharacterized protein YxeA